MPARKERAKRVMSPLASWARLTLLRMAQSLAFNARSPAKSHELCSSKVLPHLPGQAFSGGILTGNLSFWGAHDLPQLQRVRRTLENYGRCPYREADRAALGGGLGNFMCRKEKTRGRLSGRKPDCSAETSNWTWCCHGSRKRSLNRKCYSLGIYITPGSRRALRTQNLSLCDRVWTLMRLEPTPII